MHLHKTGITPSLFSVMWCNASGGNLCYFVTFLLSPNCHKIGIYSHREIRELLFNNVIFEAIPVNLDSGKGTLHIIFHLSAYYRSPFCFPLWGPVIAITLRELGLVGRRGCPPAIFGDPTGHPGRISDLVPGELVWSRDCPPATRGGPVGRPGGEPVGQPGRGPVGQPGGIRGRGWMAGRNPAGSKGTLGNRRLAGCDHDIYNLLCLIGQQFPVPKTTS